MKTKLAFLIVMIAHWGTGFSQTGIFYWPDSTTSNYRLHTIRQTGEGDIYMVGICTDAIDKNMQPLFVRTDKNGKLIERNVIDVPDLYEMSGFLLMPKSSNCTNDCYPMKLFGTKVEGGSPSLYTQPCDAKGNTQGTEAILVNSPEIMGSLATVNDSENIFSFSIQTHENRYNVRLVKEKYREVKSESYIGDIGEQEKYIQVNSPYNELCDGVIPDGDEFVYLLCSRNYSDTVQDFMIYKVSLKADSVVWGNEIKSRMNAASANICKAGDNTLVVVFNYTDKNNIVNSKTGLLKINMLNGDTSAVAGNFSMRADGLLKLKNGNYMLYGGVFKTDDSAGYNPYIKAKWILLDKNFNTIYEDEMGMFDTPDANLPSLAMTVNPTMSELAQAVQLSDGRIAFAGRVYMPNHTKPDEIIYSSRYNRPMLFITGPDGKFRKD